MTTTSKETFFHISLFYVRRERNMKSHPTMKVGPLSLLPWGTGWQLSQACHPHHYFMPPRWWLHQKRSQQVPCSLRSVQTPFVTTHYFYGDAGAPPQQRLHSYVLPLQRQWKLRGESPVLIKFHTMRQHPSYRVLQRCWSVDPAALNASSGSIRKTTALIKPHRRIVEVVSWTIRR